MPMSMRRSKRDGDSAHGRNAARLLPVEAGPARHPPRARVQRLPSEEKARGLRLSRDSVQTLQVASHTKMARKEGCMKSAIIYRGPALLDGAPIVAIATGLDGGSANPKTGPLINTWILRADIEPTEARMTGK